MTITAIEPQKRRPDRFSIYIDGTFTFGIHKNDLERCGLSLGMELNRANVDGLLSKVVFLNARDTALRYITPRARSAYEVRKRLETEDFPPEIITRVLNLMVKYRYVDDAAFAGDYAASRLKYGRYGLNRIKQELKLKGIPGELAEAAVRNAGEDEGERAAALDWLRKKRPKNLTDWAERKRMSAALVRRGFSYETVREVLDIFIEGEYE